MRISDKTKLFLAYIGLLAFILLFTSCSQSKKLQKAKETMLSNPAELAKICADRFPVKDTVIYKPGSVERDTLFEYQEIYIPVECPPSDKDTVIQWKVKREKEIVVEQYRDTSIIYRRDQAKEYSLHSEIDQLKKENSKLIAKVDTLKKYRDWMWILIIAVIIGGGLWFWFKGKTSVINSILKK